MAYFLNLFSPETYEAFANSDRNITGFRVRQRNAASRVHVGDVLICYVTKLSRWVGLLEVTSHWFEDGTPIFQPSDDPFVIRFKVKPVAWLTIDKAIPIRDERVWSKLSFTQHHDKRTSEWTGKLRSSLARIDIKDGLFLEKFIVSQVQRGEVFEIDLHGPPSLGWQSGRNGDDSTKLTLGQDSELGDSSDEELEPGIEITSEGVEYEGDALISTRSRTELVESTSGERTSNVR